LYLLRLLRREGVVALAAQHRLGMHDHLIAGHGHEGRIPAGLSRDVGHGADLARIAVHQVSGQAHAVGRRAAGALDAQADEIGVLPGDGVLDQSLRLVDRARVERPFEIDAHRVEHAFDGHVFLDGLGRDFHGAGELHAARRQIADESLLPGLRPRQPPRLTGLQQRRLGADRAPFAEFRQPLRRSVLRPNVGLDLQQLARGVDQLQRHLHRDLLAAPRDLLVDRADRVGDRGLVHAGRAELGRGGHDDHVARQHRQHRVPLDSLRHVGHRGRRVQAAPGEEIRQVVGVAHLAPPAEFTLVLLDRELEDQHWAGPLGLGLLNRLENRLAEPLGGPAGDGERDPVQASHAFLGSRFGCDGGLGCGCASLPGRRLLVQGCFGRRLSRCERRPELQTNRLARPGGHQRRQHHQSSPQRIHGKSPTSRCDSTNRPRSHSPDSAASCEAPAPGKTPRDSCK